MTKRSVDSCLQHKASEPRQAPWTSRRHSANIGQLHCLSLTQSKRRDKRRQNGRQLSLRPSTTSWALHAPPDSESSLEVLFGVDEAGLATPFSPKLLTGLHSNVSV